MTSFHYYRPEVSRRCNCGPTALAALLQMSGEDAVAAIEAATVTKWPGFTNVEHLRAALGKRGLSMVKERQYDGVGETFFFDRFDKSFHNKLAVPFLVFIQVTGRWMGKGWRAEYTHTHWALVVDGSVMDVNNPRDSENRPTWEPFGNWFKVMNALAECTMKGNGWHIRSAYRVGTKVAP